MVWGTVLSGISNAAGGGASGGGQTDATSGGGLSGMFSNAGIQFGTKSTAQTISTTAIAVAGIGAAALIMYLLIKR